MGKILFFLLISLGTMALSGCGKKSNIIPPEGMKGVYPRVYPPI